MDRGSDSTHTLNLMHMGKQAEHIYIHENKPNPAHKQSCPLDIALWIRKAWWNIVRASWRSLGRHSEEDLFVMLSLPPSTSSLPKCLLQKSISSILQHLQREMRKMSNSRIAPSPPANSTVYMSSAEDDTQSRKDLKLLVWYAENTYILQIHGNRLLTSFCTRLDSQGAFFFVSLLEIQCAVFKAIYWQKCHEINKFFFLV